MSCCLDTPPFTFRIKGIPELQYNYDDYVSELRSRMQTSHQQVYQNLIRSKNRSKKYYDEATRALKLQVGDKVLLFDETVRRGRSRKLSAQWVGPYTITEIDKVNATISRGRKVTKVHVSRFKPFIDFGAKMVSTACLLCF